MPNDELIEAATKDDCAWPACGCCWDSMCAKEVSRRNHQAAVARAKGIKRGIALERQDIARARSAFTYEQGVAAGLEMRRQRERRRVVEWLHVRANQMNDPHAKVILNLAADALGKWNARALADQHKPSPAEEPMP